MKIALASAEFIDRDKAFNLSQIEKYMCGAKERGAELVCFGESFLQGFECLTWDYETDKNMAVEIASPEMTRLRTLTRKIGIDLFIGFIEREGETLYSSYALLGGGELLHLYRRISKNWKEFEITDGHYREGDTVETFEYRGKKCAVALCGDLWIYPERFRPDADLLFWPIFVNFTKEHWESGELAAYAAHAGTVCRETVLINSIVGSDAPAFGGCYHFVDGAVRDSLPMGRAGLLTVNI